MRIDFLNDMQSLLQQEKNRNYRRRVVFFLIVGALVLFGIQLSIMVSRRAESDVMGQAAVAKFEKEAYNRSQEVAQGGTATPVIVSSSKSRASQQYRPSVNVHQHSHMASYSHSVAAPQYSFRSANTGAVTVYTTSSATVKSIGGGGSGSGSSVDGGSSVGSSIGGGSAGGSVSGASVDRNGSTSIMVVPTLARISSRELTASNILAAQEQVIKEGAADRQGQPGIRKVNGNDKPFDPFMDPIGEGVLALLLLAAAYGVFVVYHRKQRA